MNVEGNDIVIRFNTDTSQANKSIQALTTNLQKLKAAFASVNSSTVKNLQKLVDVFVGLNHVDGKGIRDIGYGIRSLIKLNEAKLSPQLAENMQQLINVIKQIPTNVGQEFKSVATGLRNLSKIADFSMTEESLKILEKLIHLIQAIPSGVFTSAGEDLKAVASGLRSLSKVEDIKISDESLNSLDKLIKLIQSIPPGMGQDIKDLASSLRILGAYKKYWDSNQQQLNVPSVYQKQTTAPVPVGEPFTNVPEAIWEERETKKVGAFTSAIELLKSSLQGLGVVLRIVKGALSDVLGAFGNALRGVWDNLKKKINSVTTAFNGFIRSVGRIAFYRAIRTAIKAVTQGFQEGIKNAYFWAKEVGNQFAASMDTIKTATNYLKNSLGAMVAPLLNSLAPAIDFIIDKFVDLLNIVNQVFALLGGQTTWFKALKYPAEYMEETAGATAKARKELKLWLASFDELNIIPNQKDTGRGGGAGDALDYGSMFEEVDLQNPLKEAIESGDWEGLGRLLAEKLNGLFDAVDFSGAGEKIGKLIGRAIDSVYGFMTTLNFTKIGQRFGELVGRAIANIDWKKVGALKVRKWTALIDLVIGFINKLDWKEVGKAFGDYFKGALEHLSDWLVSIDWNQAGRNLVDDLVDFVNGLDLNTVFTNLGQALVNASYALFDFLAGILQRLWEYIQYQIYLDHPKMAEFFGIQGEELAKKFGTKLTEGATYHTKVMVDGVGKVFRRGQETLGEESKKTVDAITKPWTINLPTAETSLRKTLNNAEGEIKEFGSQVDAVWLKKREMLLSVAIDKVSVPKFKVEYEDVSGVNLPVITARPHNIPMAYANGGFPEDGLFYANHGELVGKFNNGRTAVANNEQIIEGIKRGVAEGMSESGQGGNIYLQANLDGKVLFDAVCDRITDYFVQTGMTPFPV